MIVKIMILIYKRIFRINQNLLKINKKCNFNSNSMITLKIKMWIHNLEINKKLIIETLKFHKLKKILAKKYHNKNPSLSLKKIKKVTHNKKS